MKDLRAPRPEACRNRSGEGAVERRKGNCGMSEKRPRIGVVGSSNVDVVTYV